MSFRVAVTMVTMVMVKMRKGNVKNRHYNINILFIYSEQMTESDIDFDQNDHDHDDHGVDLSVITNHIILAGNNKNRPFHRDFFSLAISVRHTFSRFETQFFLS